MPSVDRLVLTIVLQEKHTLYLVIDGLIFLLREIIGHIVDSNAGFIKMEALVCKIDDV